MLGLFFRRKLDFTVFSRHLIQVRKIGKKDFSLSVFAPYNPETTTSSKPVFVKTVTSKKAAFKQAKDFVTRSLSLSV